MSRIPVVGLPTKLTDSVDFCEPLKEFISSHYQEDPEFYESECRELNNCRTQMIYAEPTATGRDFLYRYFGQLELLTLRFPIDEDNVKVNFEWSDAFSGSKVSQYSIAFEKACVLYNLSAVCSTIAAKSDRGDPEGLKKACNYFQVAAGVLQFINDNFLHPPSVDISRESISVLVTLLLAQAQECFVEKALSENKSGNIIARLAAYIADAYISVDIGMNSPELSNQFEHTWLGLIATKAKYYSALANYHQSILAESKNQYSDTISYLVVASQLSKDAVKTASSLHSTAKMISGFAAMFGGAADQVTFASALMEGVTNLDKIIAEKHAIAKKDNDMLYNAPIIPKESLKPIEKVCLVKVNQFYELLPNGQKDLPGIIGFDIFKRLVPLGIHEAASIYSDEKDQLRRKAKEAVLVADSDLHVTLESLEVFPTIAKLKASSSVQPSVPADLLNAISQISAGENKCTLKSCHDYVNTLNAESKNVLNEINMLLDREQYECENYRLKYSEKWSQDPSSNFNSNFKKEWAQIRESIQIIEHRSELFSVNIAKLTPLLNITQMTPHDVSQLFYRECTAETKRKSSLLDEPIVATSKSNDDNIMSEIESNIEKMKVLKAERAGLLSSLDTQLKVQEDLSAPLLFGKGRENEIFKIELAKFQPTQTELYNNINTQRQLLDKIKNLFEELQKVSENLASIKRSEAKIKSVTASWERDISFYYEVKSGIEGIKRSALDIDTALKKLNSNVKSFISNRQQERVSIIKKIEQLDAEAMQRDLKNRLSQISIVPTNYTLNNNANAPPLAGKMPPYNQGELSMKNEFVNYQSPIRQISPIEPRMSMHYAPIQTDTLSSSSAQNVLAPPKPFNQLKQDGSPNSELYYTPPNQGTAMMTPVQYQTKTATPISSNQQAYLNHYSVTDNRSHGSETYSSVQHSAPPSNTAYAPTGFQIPPNSVYSSGQYLQQYPTSIDGSTYGTTIVQPFSQLQPNPPAQPYQNYPLQAPNQHYTAQQPPNSQLPPKNLLD